MLAPQRVSSKGRPPRAQGATLLGAGAHCCPGEQGRLGDAHALSCACVPSSQRVSPGPEIKDWATSSLQRQRSWMHSGTHAGVGADRRELVAVTRRDHEQAAATEAVGHGRNRPGGRVRAPRPHRSGSTTCTSRPRGSRPGMQGQRALPSPAKPQRSLSPMRAPPTQRSLSLETAETGGQAGGRVLLFRVSR